MTSTLATASNAGARENGVVDTVLVPFTTAEIGGSHISGILLAAGLAERFGVRAVVVAPEGAAVLALAREHGLEAMPSGDVPRHRHPPHRDILRTPARFAALRRLGPRTVVHCNDLGALQAWAPAARLAGVPVIYHNRAFDRDIWPNRLVMRMANHVVSISQSCDARLGLPAPQRRSVSTDPFRTPLEIDPAPHRARLAAGRGDPDAVRIVGFIGNFWRRKRPDVFIDVAARLRRRRSPPLRDVRSRGRHHRRRPGTADRGAAASRRSSLAGFRLPRRRISPLSTFFLMPALAEPFGRTLVEAILLGIPYVAADDAGRTEIFQRWGGEDKSCRPARASTTTPPPAGRFCSPPRASCIRSPPVARSRPISPPPSTRRTSSRSIGACCRDRARRRKRDRRDVRMASATKGVRSPLAKEAKPRLSTRRPGAGLVAGSTTGLDSVKTAAGERFPANGVTRSLHACGDFGPKAAEAGDRTR